MDIASPIVIVEGGDVNFFASKDAAERYVEPIDVVNNEYKIYDSDGHILQAVVERKSGDSLMDRLVGVDVVRIRDHQDERRDEDGLREAVAHLLETAGFTGAQCGEMSLRELIERAVRVFGYTT